MHRHLDHVSKLIIETQKPSFALLTLVCPPYGAEAFKAIVVIDKYYGSSDSSARCQTCITPFDPQMKIAS